MLSSTCALCRQVFCCIKLLLALAALNTFMNKITSLAFAARSPIASGAIIDCTELFDTFLLASTNKRVLAIIATPYF